MVADVTVVGTGIIALSAALELADRGLSVRVVGTTHSGNASSAAGGMLAPSVDPQTGAAHTFAVASRDRYPGWVAALAARTGITIPMNSNGVLELAADEAQATFLANRFERPSEWLDGRLVNQEEPALMAVEGALFHPLDGSVEPLPLLDALRTAVAHHDGITTAREDCREMHASDLGCNVLTDMESRFASDYVVLAAGAWAPLIAGAGDAIAAIHPLRGQMLAFKTSPLRHVTCGVGGYLIPRSDECIVAGGSSEHAGFEAVTTPDTIEAIRSRAA
ncbi:MAG TPA: FAD-dependent oxidoreductase, partial [Gemmatimonadaceae bacterium]